MNDSPVARRKRLGTILKASREARGLSRAAVAAELETSASTIGRYETGVGSVRLKDLRQWMDFIGIDDPAQRDELEQLRAEGKRPGWWPYAAVRPTFGTLLGLEGAASELLDFEAIVIPGLLQTEAYARAVMTKAVPQLDEETITQRVAVRMRRQEALHRDKPLRLSAILDEGCLYRKVGGPDVWRDQLKHLLDMSEFRNITLQVIPYENGAHASVLGSFVILKFNDGAPVAYVELASGDLAAEGAEVARYSDMFDGLRAEALSPLETSKLIDATLRQGSK